ncbi:hypothetical protein SAMN05216490_1896 [Mucilaginibacter mallensis]|uniref:Glycosyl hydrolase catalytic core n=1 Tax=Mucilaginibacter mallensis TaxID=652787 RepID=A0A1H1VDH6_MUCMA|nr:hypothetical protein [Mucilaginibacter mallensis]SDS82794.1 hypothetical protein SAMN05216490_1896 [Mucilaginibacter mallensis]
MKKGLCLIMMLILSFVLVKAQNNKVIIGVNLVNVPQNLTVAEQESILTAMQNAGVKVIRAGDVVNDKGIKFIQRVYAHGIKIEMIVDMAYAPGTPWPSAPKGFNGLWRAPPLSKADPDSCAGYFKRLIDKLEAKGIVLAGLELGNELNWAGFNADFPLPGEGRVLGLNDLTSDPEGILFAKGLLQYLKVLTVLKNVRDQSKLNRNTPIITAGLADLSGGTWTQHEKADAVSIDATLNFLRDHGLDKLVDGYGIHCYPTGTGPGTAVGAKARYTHLIQNGLDECQPPGSKNGKPCWFTEWGFAVNTDACPVIDTARVQLVNEMRGYFGQLAKQQRLGGLLFYNWQGNIHAVKEDRASAFRCGSLTESGRIAIANNLNQ